MSTGLPVRIGRYEIIGRLGGGGMGVVYKAHDPQIGRDVAIKQIREELDSQDLRERMLREVRATGRLRHNNIVSIFDIGEHEGFPFIVMEFVEGRTVAEIIAAGDPLPLRARLDLMAQLCAGLAAAHDAGIIHRDVKPANLIVDTAGMLKIVDFGIARLTASHTATVAIGTANYMSPEQWTGHGVDHRTDVFAAGAVFYELLAGRKAFLGRSLPEIMQRVMNEPPVPLDTLCDGLDPQIVQIVHRMLDKTPAHRFDSLTPVRTKLLEVHTRLTKTSETAYASTIRMRRDELLAAAASASTDAGVDLAAVERRRTTQIETHLRNAHAAFERGDLEQAAVACEDALVLDPQRSTALDLLKQIRRLQTRGTGEKPSTGAPVVASAATPAAEPPERSAQPAIPPAASPSVPNVQPPPPPSAQIAAARSVSQPAVDVSASVREPLRNPAVIIGGLAAAVIVIAYLAWPRTPDAPPATVAQPPQSAVASASPQPAEPPPAPAPSSAAAAETAPTPPPAAAPPPQPTPAAPAPAPRSAATDSPRGTTPPRTSTPPRATPQAAPTPPPAAAPVRVGGSITQPRKTKDVAPTYPAAAQQARVQGIVILEATIGTDGKVQDAKVLRSIPLLDAAALDAVRQWEYTPTLFNGVPTPVIMTVTVNFTMTSRRPSVEGLDPDAVLKLLGGPPSSTQSEPGGVRIWYYDRPEGTLTIYFKDNRASLRRPQ